MDDILKKIEDDYTKFHELVKKQVGDTLEAGSDIVTSSNFDPGVNILKGLCESLELIETSCVLAKYEDWDMAFRSVSKFHALVFQWITSGVAKADLDRQLPSLLECIFCNPFFIRPIAILSFSAFLRAQSVRASSFGSSTVATLWLTTLNQLIAVLSFRECLSYWKKLAPIHLQERRLLVLTSSLYDGYLSIPPLVSNSRLEIANIATSKLGLSNFLQHTGQLFSDWLDAIQSDDVFQLGLFSRMIQKLHRAGYLNGTLTAIRKIPFALLVHKDFQTVVRPFMKGMLMATHRPVEGLSWEGFGCKVDLADPVGHLIQSCAEYGFESPLFRNAIIPLLVDPQMKAPVAARIATHLALKADKELFAQVLHYLFVEHWPDERFFIQVGEDDYLSRCFLLGFFVLKAPASALDSISSLARRQISLALQGTHHEIRSLELILAQAIVNKARPEGQAVVDLPLGNLSPRVTKLKELLSGTSLPGPTLSVSKEVSEVPSTGPIDAKISPPRYLQECIQYLKGDEERLRVGMDQIFCLIQSADIGVLNEAAPELTGVLVGLPSPEICSKSLVLLLTRSFKQAARPLVEILFRTQQVDFQLACLNSLHQAVLVISQSPKPSKDILSSHAKGVVTWQSARLVTKFISTPTAEGRGLFPSQVFFPIIRSLRVSGTLGQFDLLFLEAILMLLSTVMYYSRLLPELDLMTEAYMGLLAHLRLHPDPKLQKAVLLAYSATLPESPSPRWLSLSELPALLDYCHDLADQSKHKEIVQLASSVAIQIAKIVDHVREKTFI